jgi:large subunit ribosomal protein L10
MALNKTEKTQVIDSVRKILEKAKTVVFVNFHKLTVLETTQVRKALRENGVGYYVAKKTLAKRALTERKIAGELPALDGEVAIVYSDDQIAPAREIYNFQKKFDGRVNILGGIFEEGYKGRDAMLSIAAIPGRQTLYAQFVNLINSPIQGLVLAVNAIADKKV